VTAPESGVPREYLVLIILRIRILYFVDRAS
jgi:hypothetical protein